MNFFNFNTISFILEPLTLPLKLNFFFGNIAFISLFIAVLLYWFDFFDTRRGSKKLKNFCMIGANISLAFLLIQRWSESGHFPLSNLYESLIGLSWGFTSVHLMIVLNPTEFFSQITKVLNSTAKRAKKNQIYQFQKDFRNTENGTVLSYLNNGNKVREKEQRPSSVLKRKDHANDQGAVINNITSSQSPDYIVQKTVSPSSLSSVSFARKEWPVQNMTTNPELNFSRAQSFTVARKENILDLNKNSKLIKEISSPLSKVNDKLGAITAPTALLTSVFATFFLPPEITQASALIPALKSNWLTMHVTVMVASYAFLLIGCLLSITYCVYGLVKQFSNKNSKAHVFQSNLKPINLKQSFLNAKNPINYKNQSLVLLPPLALLAPIHQQKKQEKVLTICDNKKEDKVYSSANQANFSLALWLNTTSYRILGLGFPLLTIGILSGAVWANEAWGSYWSWDPKETWALITWLVFAVYFHSRYTRKADSFVPAAIASVGFVMIWICYLGVNLLGTGLHSYGWFSS